MKPVRAWDALDISVLIEASLDGFAVEFCGCAFDQLTDKQASRILGAIRSHVNDLDDAQKEQQQSRKKTRKKP